MCENSTSIYIGNVFEKKNIIFHIQKYNIVRMQVNCINIMIAQVFFLTKSHNHLELCDNLYNRLIQFARRDMVITKSKLQANVQAKAK